MTDNPLTRIPVITQAILDAQPLEYHADKIGELGHYLKYLSGKLDATIELKNDAAEAQIRICRNAGLRFPEMARRGGDGSNQHEHKEQTQRYKPLADYGFNKYRANLCRKIARIPEELFENEIITIRTTEHLTGREVTMKYFVNMEWIDKALKAGTYTDRPYTPPTTITISTSDMTAAARSIRAGLSTQQVHELIDELRKQP